MPCRNLKLRVWDILEAIEGARNYFADMSFEEFLKDARTIDAVVRKLTIIREAEVYIPDSIWGKSHDVPWIDMRAMRNFVVHEYFGISERIVWDTLQDDFPGIVEPLKLLFLLEDD